MECVSVREERILDIVSAISELDGPLAVLGYLTTLQESEMYLFLNYVKGSKYGKYNFYDGIKLFSQDYIRNKKAKEESIALKEFGFMSGDSDYFGANYTFSNDYFEQFVSIDDSVRVGNSRSGR